MAKTVEDEPNHIAVIATAINEVMKEVDYVQKTGTNDCHKYRYASEADVLESLRPAMVKHGLVLIPSVQQVSTIDAYGNTNVSINYTLIHTSGAVWPQPILAAGCGGDKNKNGVGDKGVYKAITGANKYVLFKLFQIETGDAEPEDTRGDEDRAAPQTDEAARKFYLEGAKIAISKADAVSDIKDWWEKEKNNRYDAGVVKGTEEYSELYEAFLKKGNSLKEKS